MFTWLAILCCHLVCGAGETKSTCKSYAGKKRPKKKRLGHQMMHGKAIWKSGIGETAKAPRGIAPGPYRGTYSTPYELPAAGANMLTYVGLWAMAIKRSNSAWIKPWYCVKFQDFSKILIKVSKSQDFPRISTITHKIFETTLSFM